MSWYRLSGKFKWCLQTFTSKNVGAVSLLLFFLILSDRSLLRKPLFSIMHSSWKHWWKATSRTPCPTALYILVCSCSATRSWLDMWLRSVSCWTSWSQSSSTWWRVALLKVSFRVSCPNVSGHSDWTLQVSMKQVADIILLLDHHKTPHVNSVRFVISFLAWWNWY